MAEAPRATQEAYRGSFLSSHTSAFPLYLSRPKLPLDDPRNLRLALSPLSFSVARRLRLPVSPLPAPVSPSLISSVPSLSLSLLPFRRISSSRSGLPLSLLPFRRISPSRSGLSLSLLPFRPSPLGPPRSYLPLSSSVPSPIAPRSETVTVVPLPLRRRSLPPIPSPYLPKTLYLFASLRLRLRLRPVVRRYPISAASAVSAALPQSEHSRHALTSKIQKLKEQVKVRDTFLSF